MEQDVLTPQEVADLLKIKKTTVYEMIKRGDIPATKLGKQLRIQKRDIMHLLQNNQTISPAYKSNESSNQVKTSTIVNHKQVSHSTVIDHDVVNTTSSSNIHVKQNSAYINESNSSIILCGQDMLLDVLANKINTNTFRPNILRSYLGSYNGLYAMYQGQVHIATAHLWDAETDSYNITYTSKLLPGIKVRIYHLVKRMQGFYVQKGNPKNITGFGDLSRTDIRYANREKGSGTRILLDNMLNKLSIPASLLPGYEIEMNTHHGVASAIAKHEADFGLGTSKASKDFDTLEFLPLKEESYDLIIREEDMEHPVVKLIISTIQSKEFRKEIDLLGSFNTDDMGIRIL